MDINQQLIRWNARYMMLGDFIACKACLLPQQVNDADLPFDHEDGCKHAVGAQFPWSELLQILACVPRAKNIS
ncbi:MAG: Uncharacterized protein JWP80_1999 [Pseudomonas sp.]|nr:Uncharacterized protein [Pseudomonas sp.]